MTLDGLLASFDVKERKGFTFSQIVTSFRGLDETENANPNLHFEWVAFMLQPNNHERKWGYYYGPHFSGVDESGVEKDVPSLSDITPDAIAYWEKRYKEASNPLLVMRYAGLVWEFKRNIVHQGFEKGLYETVIESMLTVCNYDYCRHPVETVIVLERLFSIARSNVNDLVRVKATYESFEARHAKDSSVLMWASRFQMMLTYKNAFSDKEIESIVTEHEARLNRISTPNEKGLVDDPWLVEKQATLLANYYLSRQQKDEIRRVLRISEDAFIKAFPMMNPLQREGNIETVYHKYLFYGLYDEAARLSSLIQQLGVEAKESMAPQKFEFSIPKEVFDQIELCFGEGVSSDEERWSNFARFYIPNRSNAVLGLKELVKQYPLVYLMSTKLFDPKGRPMSHIGSYELDPEGQLVLHIAKSMNLGSFSLNAAIQTLIHVGCFTSEKFIDDVIKPSPLFEDNRQEIIKKAIDFYLAGDYLNSCHLLVPQIENAIRNLVEISGGAVIKQQRQTSHGFQLKTLDELLRQDCVKEVFTEDGAFYFRLVLTDQRALNLRNLLCHGILPPESFGVGAADRLIHVLVLLGLVRFIENRTN